MRQCFVLRVFTRDGMGGNHLGVVTDVSGLTERAMAQVATNLGFSETIFLDRRAGDVPTARIFTPAGELPFAGHPLVGAAWLYNSLGPLPVDRISCGIGEVRCRFEEGVSSVTTAGGQPVRAGGPDFGAWIDPVDVRTVDMPLPNVVAELGSPEAVASLDYPELSDTILVWSWVEPGTVVKARFFTREHGVTEDPATGSAAVALAAVLVGRGVAEGDIQVLQGDEVGFPSTIRLAWNGSGVTIAGTVVHDETRELDL